MIKYAVTFKTKSGKITEPTTFLPDTLAAKLHRKRLQDNLPEYKWIVVQVNFNEKNPMQFTMKEIEVK